MEELNDRPDVIMNATGDNIERRADNIVRRAVSEFEQAKSETQGIAGMGTVLVQLDEELVEVDAPHSKVLEEHRIVPHRVLGLFPFGEAVVTSADRATSPPQRDTASRPCADTKSGITRSLLRNISICCYCRENKVQISSIDDDTGNNSAQLR